MNSPALEPSEVAQNAYLTIAMSSVPVGTPLPYSLHIRIAEKWIVLRARGDKLEAERAASLVQRKVAALGVLRAEWAAYVEQLEAALDRIGVKEGNEESALRVRSLLHAYFREVEDRRGITENFLEKIQSTAGKMPTTIGQSREIAHRMLKRENDPSLYFSSHAVNMAVYCVAIGMKFGMKPSSLQELAFAASVANIGNIQIDTEILYKASPLTDAEWVTMRTHPTKGADILKLLLASGPVIAAVADHSEKFDGSGYPRGLRGDTISLYGRIISIAEVFSALTSTRPWAAALEPHRAIEVVQRLRGRFDPELLRFV